eukprot:Sdes_comp20064_c0_seq1m12952
MIFARFYGESKRFFHAFILSVALLNLLLAINVEATLSKENPGSIHLQPNLWNEPSEEESDSLQEKYSRKFNLQDSLYSKHWVTPNIEVSALRDQFKFTQLQPFPIRNITKLGYITPWNKGGSIWGKRYAHRFTHLSPVWFQLKPKGNSFHIEGTHEVDSKWMSQVKQEASHHGQTVSIVPRIILENWQGNHYVEVFSDELAMKKVISIITSLCRKHSLDGIVLELYFHLISQQLSQLREGLVRFINLLGDSLHMQSQQLILAVAPASSGFASQDFKDLDQVDYFSVMTYDYSNPSRPGPNSPYVWMKENIELVAPDLSSRSKILMGLNFYGNDYMPLQASGGPIISHDFMKILETNSPKIEYLNDDVREHIFHYREGQASHQVYFPTLWVILQFSHLPNSLKPS